MIGSAGQCGLALSPSTVLGGYIMNNYENSDSNPSNSNNNNGNANGFNRGGWTFYHMKELLTENLQVI